MRKRIIFVLFGLLTLAFVVNGYLRHPLPSGRLLHTQAFSNGDALTVSRTNGGLQVGYYDVNGFEVLSQPLDILEEPETLNVQACGGRLQIFVSYRASVPGDLSTAYAERFVLPLPVSQGCESMSYLPVVLKGEQ